MISRQASVLALLIAVPLALEFGCGSDNEDPVPGTVTGAGAGATTGSATGGSGGTTTSAGGSSTTSASGGAGVGGGTGGTGGAVPPPPTEKVQCINKFLQCGDLLDNDNDGLIDYQDPDCLGPCDDTEDSYFPALSGASGQNCDLDCFWDNGQGHDWNCYWDHQCDPNSLTSGPEVNPQDLCAYTGTAQEQVGESFSPMPNNETCESLYSLDPGLGQDQECLDKCMPLAPNGCDCFGCCLIAGETVWLGSYDASGNGTCTRESVGTPAFLDNCRPCTQVPSCLNDCGTCELCLGKTELPPECYGGGGGGAGQGGAGGAPQDCPAGQDACGLPGQPPCGADAYCITGCCVPIPK